MVARFACVYCLFIYCLCIGCLPVIVLVFMLLIYSVSCVWLFSSGCRILFCCLFVVIRLLGSLFIVCRCLLGFDVWLCLALATGLFVLCFWYSYYLFVDLLAWLRCCVLAFCCCGFAWVCVFAIRLRFGCLLFVLFCYLDVVLCVYWFVFCLFVLLRGILSLIVLWLSFVRYFR